MGDINALLDASSQIASDTIPAGGSGEGTSIIMQIFEANPGKYFTGRDLKKLFKENEVEIKAVSNILHALHKQGKLDRPKTGVYTLAE